MSVANCLLTEDQFCCPICLDVFTDPVTTPCGHNFCKSCISELWGENISCKCPICRETFDVKPELRVNTLLSGMVAQFREAPQLGEVPRDLCVTAKRMMWDVILDPKTANPHLILSDDGKQVKHGDVRKNLPDNPERFSHATCVLAKQSITSGILYYEVQVRGKTDWALGVAAERMTRKGGISLMPGAGNWTIWLRRESGYSALDGKPTRLSLPSRPEKVGVFVNYEGGLVTFFDVDSKAVIFSFTGCSFMEKIYPIFCPGNNAGGTNSAPLIIL